MIRSAVNSHHTEGPELISWDIDPCPAVMPALPQAGCAAGTERGRVLCSFSSGMRGRREAGGSDGEQQQHLPIAACSGRADPSALAAVAADPSMLLMRSQPGSCFHTETKIILFWRLQKAKTQRQYLHLPVMCHCVGQPSLLPRRPCRYPLTGGGSDSPDGICLSNVTSNMGH